MQAWSVLHLARWKCRTQKRAKNSSSGHHRTSLSCYIFANKKCVDNRKKTVEYQYLFHMSSQYGELRSTSCWDLLASLWHSTKFQRISGFGSVNLLYGTLGVGVNQTAALSRGRQLYSARRPSRWAMAHSSCIYIYLCYHYYLPTHILFFTMCTFQHSCVLTGYYDVQVLH